MTGGICLFKTYNSFYPTDCDKTFTQNSGIITSPGYPNSYERKTCVWLIKADPNKIITLNFTKFNVEDSYQCRYDYLEIRF